MKAAVFAIGATLAASSLATAWTQSVRVSDDWVTLRSPGGGFHVRMPPDWDVDTPARAGSGLSFRPKKLITAAAEEFVNCKAEAGSNPAIATSTQATLDAAVTASPAPSSATKELSATLGEDAVVRENSLMQVSNRPVYFIVVSGSREMSNVRIHAVAAEAILVRPGSVYSLACTVGARTAEQAEVAWTKWRPVFLDIISTFDSESQ